MNPTKKPKPTRAYTKKQKFEEQNKDKLIIEGKHEFGRKDMSRKDYFYKLGGTKKGSYNKQIEDLFDGRQVKPCIIDMSYEIEYTLGERKGEREVRNKLILKMTPQYICQRKNGICIYCL